MKIKYVVVLLFSIATTSSIFSQTHIITGSLTDEGNEPVASATLTLKQSGQKTKSKNDGSFSLPYNGNEDTLLITHVGFKTMSVPVTVFTKFPLLIILSRLENTLEEVVINTGYQQLPKERATGSFTQIDNALFNEQIGTDIMSRLPAIANGLSEGSKINTGNLSIPGKILVRGLSSINGPTAPLIILDNFPYEGDLQNINPNDVESITLLKDAAAASIWGARAGNGVIVITTKKGRFNQKIKVEFNSNLKITQKPDLFYAQTISSPDLVDVEEFLFSKGYRFSDTSNSSHPPFSPVYEILFQRKKGAMSESEANSLLNDFRSHDVRDDFNKYIYREAVNQQYAINIRGGSDNMAWILSGGIDKNMDVLSAGYNRFNFRSDNTIKLNKRFQINTSLYFIESESKSGKEGYGNIKPKLQNLPSYFRFIDSKGNQASMAKEYRSVYTDSAGGGKLLDWNYYPLEDYKHAYTTTKIQDIIGNLSFSYEFFKGFSASVKYQFEKQMLTSSGLNDVESYYTRSLINTFYQPASANKFPVPMGGILTTTHKSNISHNVRGQLNFNKVWKAHEIVAIMGAEVRQISTDAVTDQKYGYDDDILTSGGVDMSNTYKSFVTGSSGYIPSFKGISESISRFVSLFGNASYTYNQKYTVSLSGRRDASNIFGINTNDKWNPLWSTGAKWAISDESFYHFRLFPQLNLRVTYGVSGNIDPSLSAVTALTYLNSSPYTFLPMAEVSQFYNPDLRWEKIRQLNIGMDVASKNHRIRLSLDYFIKRGIDLYSPSELDPTIGLGRGYIQKNAASMAANGLDVEINSININREFKWETNLNLNIYHDKITSYYLTSEQASRFVSNGNNLSGLIGKPVYSVFSYKWGGLDPVNGDPQGFLDGKISKDYSSIIGSGTALTDLIYSGPGMPTLYGSLGNTISYKGISITARITYKFGYYFRKSSVRYASLFSALESTADFADRWQKPGDEQFTNVPSMVYPAVSARDQFYNNSEILIEKGDHIRLQYITLAYNISKRKMKNLPFENIRLYINANNLGILWKANKSNLDPDYSINSIPLSKNLALGININF